jgi:hypothetical protein
MSHPADAVSVSGRDAPRESGPPVAHEMRYAAVVTIHEDGTHCPDIHATCACGYEWLLQEPYYTLEKLMRLAVMHEQARPS